MNHHPLSVKLAIIGDLHGQWDAGDTAYFNASDVDGLLFTGDIASFTDRAMHRVVDDLLDLQKPFAVIAGNHDCVTMPALLGEILGKELPSNLAARTVQRRYKRLHARLGERLLAYSTLQLAGLPVVGARPFAMDGQRFSFSAAVRRIFGIQDLGDSARRISALLDDLSGPVILLSHNGPRGLGDAPGDPYGVDFRPGGGDNGDPDLAEAIATHREKVRLVVSGHMHHAVRGQPGTLRRYVVHQEGVLYVNGARVPRYSRAGESYCLHVALEEGRPTQVHEIRYSRDTLRTTAADLIWSENQSTA